MHYIFLIARHIQCKKTFFLLFKAIHFSISFASIRTKFSCLNIVSHKTENLNYYKCFIITLGTNLSDSTIYIDLLSPSSVRPTHLCQAIIRNGRQYIGDAGVGVLCQRQAGGRLLGGRLSGAGGGLPVIGRQCQCMGFNSNKLV